MQIRDFQNQRNLEESAGLGMTVVIADYYDILSFPTLPNLETGETNAAYVMATGAFEMKPGKQFHVFHSSLEQNSFNSKLVGSPGAMTHENVLTIRRNSASPELIGYVRSMKNRELVVGFKPLGESTYTIIGWEDLWAMVTEGEIDIPKEVSGEKHTTLMIRSIYLPPIKVLAIPLTPAPID
jgi:hypothetical protein